MTFKHDIQESLECLHITTASTEPGYTPGIEIKIPLYDILQKLKKRRILYDHS